jgi:phosphomannomutase
MDVIYLGECDTSMIYFAVNHLGAAGGVQVTASHNPVHYNGFKVSGQLAKPIGAQSGLNDIKAIALACGGPGSQPPLGRLEEMDLWAPYRRHVLKFYTPPAGGRKLKVFVDASNGMGGALVPKVFDHAPGLELIRLNFEHGPNVPFAHEPNPLVAENMAPTQRGTLQHHADLGACFDGDADRCMFTDETGAIVGCDHLTALLTEPFVRQYPSTTIVYDLRSSKAVEERIRACGATPLRSRVGHVFMKSALRSCQGAFGGELSGHFYFRDNYYADSGAIAFAATLSVLGAASQPLSKLIAPFKKYPQSGEINFHAHDKQAAMDAVRARHAGARIDDLDGVTIDSFDDKGFWFNVRASNTEPLLRLNAEARDQATLDQLLAELKPMLGTEAVGH